MRWALVVAALAACSRAPAPADAGVDLATPDLAYTSQWTGDCCGLVCTPGRFCVMEEDGAVFCAPAPDGGVCRLGLCGSCDQPLQCALGTQAHCEDYPPQCLNDPSCGCLIPYAHDRGNCQQNCNDSMVESAGILRCFGI